MRFGIHIRRMATPMEYSSFRDGRVIHRLVNYEDILADRKDGPYVDLTGRKYKRCCFLGLVLVVTWPEADR